MTKVRDGLYGLIVADALGVPAESRTREDLRSNLSPVWWAAVCMVSLRVTGRMTAV